VVVLVAQTAVQPSFAEPAEDEAVFELGAYATPARAGDLGSVDVFVGVSNDRLQFAKRRGRLTAEYTVGIDLLTEDGIRVKGKTIRHRRTARGYGETNNAELRQITHARFDMAFGEFRVAVRLRDEDLRKEFRRSRKIEVKSVGPGELGLSDIILLADRAEAAAGRFDDFQSICFQIKADHKPALYAVFRAVGDVGEQATGRALLRHPAGEVARDVQFTLPGQDAWRFIELSSEGLPTTAYDVEITLRNDKGLEAKSKRKLVIRAAGMSPLVDDLDEAIEQLRYVADNKQRKRMMEAQGDERRELFDAFWKTRDPSPGTPVNELMDEYYRRIQEADARFRCYKAGWKTDRGWVYVTHGEPSEIERFPFELDTHPYEIWRYYNPDRRFVFVDRNGFGDYDMVESEGGNFRYGVD